MRIESEGKGARLTVGDFSTWLTWGRLQAVVTHVAFASGRDAERDPDAAFLKGLESLYGDDVAMRTLMETERAFPGIGPAAAARVATEARGPVARAYAEAAFSGVEDPEERFRIAWEKNLEAIGRAALGE